MTVEFVVLIVAAAQAFLLALLIYQKHRSLYANRFLSLMMLAGGIAVLHMLAQDNGFYDAYPRLLYAVLGIPFLVGPLHYLYTKYLVYGGNTFARRDLVHFVSPAVVEALALAAIVTLPGRTAEVLNSNAELVPLQFKLYNWILIVFGIAYTLISLRILLRYGSTVKDVVSSLEKVRLNWLTMLSVAALALWTMFLFENTLMTFGINLTNFVLTTVCGGIYIYGIGYSGLLKSEVFAAPGVGDVMQEISRAAAEQNTPGRKYRKSGLDDASAEAIVLALKTFMEKERPYADPSLTLTGLAKRLSVSPHNLSEAINSRINKKFYDLINEYRIVQVKKDLSDPSKRDLKILAIAFDAGFNSKASFNEIFKSSTGLTPSEYRNRLLTNLQ